MRTFADDVTPGQEAVQIFGYEEPSLLETWSDQPYLIAGAIDSWVSAGGSSFMLGSITRAAHAFLERDGIGALLLLGDAVGGGIEGAGGLPIRDLELSRPAIFPVHLGGIDDPFVSTRIMHDLAAAGGGFYQYATSQAAIERAFDRMATWLRRPAPYALSYATSAVSYPPDTIAVVAAEGATVRIGGVGVELILGTSGSMLQPLAGSSRIAVAKDVLTRLVSDALPEGLPVALRTFKAGKAACATQLAVDLRPLDRAEMTRVIERLKVTKNTKTPIGASLAAVGGDLGETTGPKIVVLVTDGKETCKGDPAAALQALIDQGIDATVNIVGLALVDEGLKQRMEGWAGITGGGFFDAQDPASLAAGIATVLQAPFRVIDRTGELVAEGVVGGSVQVPPGHYRVEVLSEPAVTFPDVAVEPSGTVQLTVGEE